jgi:hypothetical protein
LLDARRLHLVHELKAEHMVTIAQQIARCSFLGERFPELVSRPLSRRMCCDRKVNDALTLMRQHREHVKNLKANGRHGEEIHGNEALQMILQERSPSL